VSKSEVSNAHKRLAALRERASKIGENTNANASERATICTGLLDVLPTIREANADNGKEVRRILRHLGHRISDSGYEVKFAKAKRNAKRNAKANADTPPTVDANANANDNANV
jgi:hypothetical protein